MWLTHLSLILQDKISIFDLKTCYDGRKFSQTSVPPGNIQIVTNLKCSLPYSFHYILNIGIGMAVSIVTTCRLDGLCFRQ
jgi:hypothetical protein